MDLAVGLADSQRAISLVTETHRDAVFLIRFHLLVNRAAINRLWVGHVVHLDLYWSTRARNAQTTECTVETSRRKSPRVTTLAPQARQRAPRKHTPVKDPA